MKNLSALVLALAMMVSVNVFAADTDTVNTAGGANTGVVPKDTPAAATAGGVNTGDVPKDTTTAATAGGESTGDVPKGTPAMCPCGKEADGSLKWCPCGSAGTGIKISTTAIIAGVAVAGVIAAVAGHSSSATQH
jgi:hypothetical protein